MHKATRLHPQPQISLPTEKIYEDLEFPKDKRKDYPYVAINAVTTLDGKLSREGRSSGIGSNLDRRLMRLLRSKFDAVLVGSGTVRAERLSLTVPEDLAEQRERRGESRQPLGIVLSRTGELSADSLSQVSPNLLLLTEEDIPNRKDHDRGSNLDKYLRLLHSRNNVRKLLVEGGPSVNHQLFERRLVDELFITLSPKVYSGNEVNLLRGPSLQDPAPSLRLTSVFLSGEELFLRYSCTWR